MSTASVWIGINVLQNQLDVYAHPSRETLHLKNNSEGIEQLIKFLNPLQLERVVLEATGRLV